MTLMFVKNQSDCQRPDYFYFTFFFNYFCIYAGFRNSAAFNVGKILNVTTGFSQVLKNTE